MINGALTITGGVIDSTVPGIKLTDNAQEWNGNFTFVGSQDLNMGSGAVTMNGNYTVTVGASTLTVGGNISAASYNLVKSGSGPDNDFDQVGDLLTYSYLVTNTGLTTVTGIVLTDDNVDGGTLTP